MKTIDVSPEEMKRRTARFSELKPYKQTQNDAKGIPPGAMEMVSAKSVYPVMSPEGWSGRNSMAAVKGALNQFTNRILESELEACMSSCMEGEAEERLKKVLGILSALLKQS